VTVIAVSFLTEAHSEGERKLIGRTPRDAPTNFQLRTRDLPQKFFFLPYIDISKLTSPFFLLIILVVLLNN